MKFNRYITLFVAVMFAAAGLLHAQEDTSGQYSVTEMENNQTAEEETDGESEIIDLITPSAQQIVDIANSIVDIVATLEEEDSLVSRFAIYNNDNGIVAYDENEQNNILQKLDVIQAKDNEDYDFTFVRQTLYNDNRQAWDFIYERIYDHEGKLIFFVRRYNTYNSDCAEVAFERSEYYYDNEGNLVKKTYEIFDSENNDLDLDNCWMQRESYEKFMTLTGFYSKYIIPIQ